MSNEIKLGNVMVDCDDELKLQRFYGELLGWEMCNLFDKPAVRSSEGIVFLFIEEPDYVKPVWSANLYFCKLANGIFTWIVSELKCKL